MGLEPWDAQVEARAGFVSPGRRKPEPARRCCNAERAGLQHARMSLDWLLKWYSEDKEMMRSWVVRSIAGLVVVGLGVVWLTSGSAASAGDAPGIAAATGVTATTLGADQAKYVGSKKCKMCHSKEFKSWADTAHAKAYDALKPGERSEAKAKAKLDSGKDYTTDESCLGCHVVGFGKESGFAIESDEKKAGKMIKVFGAVGCESCHGAGSDYNKLHKEIQKSKRTYKQSEMHEAGMNEMGEDVCLGCHNDKSPTFDASTPFDYEASKKDGVHEIRELKQRED